MRVLLDTQMYLWFLTDSGKLSKKARAQISAADEVFVSAASIWEASIKMSIGKLSGDIDELVTAIEVCGFAELPILAKHAALTATLPPHHRDPFDRLLIAQAIYEPMHLLTSDRQLEQYSALVINPY